MPVQMSWKGLAEFREALKQLPEDVGEDAIDLVQRHADAAYQRVYDRYPERHDGQPKKGKSLREGLVRRVVARSRFGIDIVVRSTANHAHLFEYGTATRQNKRGANRGAMPPAKVFRPETRAEQVQLIHDLVAMLKSHGLTVNASEVL